MIRFGWIDHGDWTGQTASTGQAATLSTEAYEHKLVAIGGRYLLNAPIELAHGIGPKTIEGAEGFLEENCINTIGEFVRVYQRLNPDGSDLSRIYNAALSYPGDVLKSNVIW